MELKLRSDVFPLKRDEVDNTNNLDLNTTARKNEKTVEKASPYLINATYSVLIANLARPIGEFNDEAACVSAVCTANSNRILASLMVVCILSSALFFGVL